MAKILVVEDIHDNFELVLRALSGTDHKIIHASDAETGLQFALDNIPDLILLDLGLPDYDGQTLAGWLREKPELANTPIIALSAWPEENAIEMVKSYGFSGYISKPITRVADFVARINSFLKAK